MAVTERYVYGSERICTWYGENLWNTTITWGGPAYTVYGFPDARNRHYEMHDHLGNVRATLEARAMNRPTGNVWPRKYFNYYAFGGLQPYRWYDGGDAHTFGFNGQERKDDYKGKGNHNHALYWEYDTRIGRRWNLDPVDQINISNYAVNSNNPIWNNDPMGDFNTRFGAWVYKLRHGGGEIRKDKSTGEWYVGTEMHNVEGDVLYRKRFDWSGRNHTVNNHTDPWHLGLQWSSGTGPREQHFIDGDPMTDLLKQHEHIEATRQLIKKTMPNNEINHEYPNSYDLGSLAGVPKYVRDYSTLLTFGMTGNIAVTYLGSYVLTYTITENDIANGMATVHFHVQNASTMASATHPPVIGYTRWWGKYIGTPLNNSIKKGAFSETKQTFDWDEKIKYK